MLLELILLTSEVKLEEFGLRLHMQKWKSTTSSRFSLYSPSYWDMSQHQNWGAEKKFRFFYR